MPVSQVEDLDAAHVVGVSSRTLEPVTFWLPVSTPTSTVSIVVAGPPCPPADVRAPETDGVLQVRVRDDGCGGADFSAGSGLVGLKDRAEALGGHLDLSSPPGGGTALEVSLPLDVHVDLQAPPEAADSRGLW